MPIVLAVAGLVLTLVGGVSYFFLLGVPWIRAHGWPNLAVMLIGLGLTAWAIGMAKRKLGVGIVGGVQALVVAFFVLSLNVFADLPAPQRAAESQPASRQARMFTLPDQNGKPVSLADALAKGPVLLVFYRGFW